MLTGEAVPSETSQVMPKPEMRLCGPTKLQNLCEEPRFHPAVCHSWARWIPQLELMPPRMSR
eukprot:6484267-Amphidinium_carterae.1